MTTVTFQPLTEVVMHVEKGYRMECPDGCPKDIYDVMSDAWELRPENRPDFKKVLEKLTRLRHSI